MLQAHTILFTTGQWPHDLLIPTLNHVRAFVDIIRIMECQF